MNMNSICGLLTAFVIMTIPVSAQEGQSANDIVLKMQHDLNLSQDQVANITQIVQRYVDASNELQKSIDDGTISESAIDSQTQQIKAAEEQGIAQYLRSDQLNEWNQIQGQADQQDDDQGNGTPAPGVSESADQYSNLPGH